MPSELDRRFDDDAGARSPARADGWPSARTSWAGRSSPIFRRRLPAFFSTFCALNAANEAVVAGDERLTFADLDRISDGSRTGSSRAGSARATASPSRCATARPGSSATWRSSRPAASRRCSTAGGKPHEMEHALALTEPKLIIADAPRAKRIEERAPEATSSACRSSSRSNRRIGAARWTARTKAPLPEIAPEDDATILFTSGSTGEAKGALSTHRAVTTGVYAYATGLIVLLRPADAGGPRRRRRRARCSACRCSMSPAKCR